MPTTGSNDDLKESGITRDPPIPVNPWRRQIGINAGKPIRHG